MNNIIETIKKELKEGEVLEDIDIESVEEVQEYEINRPRNRKMKGSLLKKGALALALAMTLNGPVIQTNNDNNISVVEAATKDKKKPTIKMKGKKNITTYQNKAIKLGKVTAKDNVDGNVTKKITVKVKKGKKNYSSLAKKAKSNKKIKFTAPGKYIITYIVKDKAGNKTTKKRYITVKPIKREVITTEQPVIIPTTEMPIITEQPITEYIPVEIPTTEYMTEYQPTTQAVTEAPTTERRTEYQPTTQVVTEVPTTERRTEYQPTTQVVTETPTTERRTEYQPTTQFITEAPTTERRTEYQPTTQFVTEAPTTERRTEYQPTTQITTEVSTTERRTEYQPTTQVVTEVPTTERRTEYQPTTQVVTETPTTERRTEYQPTTQFITEAPTTERRTEYQPTTQITTEVSTTENSTEEKYYNANLSDYADYDVVTVNGINYNIVKDIKGVNYEDVPLISDEMARQIKFDFDNIYTGVDDGQKSYEKVYIGIGDNSPFRNIENIGLYFIGKMSLKNEDINLSNNILLQKSGSYFFVFFVNTDDKLYRTKACFRIVNSEYEKLGAEADFGALSIPSEDPMKPTDNEFQCSNELELMISPKLKNPTTIDGKELILKPVYVVDKRSN